MWAKRQERGTRSEQLSADQLRLFAQELLKAVLPPAPLPHDIVVTGQKGEGEGAGSLGLQDWLPEGPGEMLALAFDSDRMTRARDFELLGAGANALAAWNDCQRFFGCLRRSKTLAAESVAVAITQAPGPQSTFFRLMFEHDRRPFTDAAVIRALGAYFGDSRISPMERRTVVAFYTSPPDSADTGALSVMAAGLFQLVFDLVAMEQAASAGVVIQRIHGFFHQPSGGYRVPAPANALACAEALRQLMAWPPASVAPVVGESMGQWLAQH